MTNKIIETLRKRKLFIILAIIVLIGGGYYFWNKGVKSKAATGQVVTARVEKGTIISSVSGNGQVSASSLIDIQPKGSGDITYVGIAKGQEIKRGTLLMKIDTTDAQKALQDAEINLETAKVQLANLLEPEDELTILQARNALSKANDAKQTAEDNIDQGYEDAYNTITNAFFDLPTINTGTRDILYSYDIGKSESSLPDYNDNIMVLMNTVGADNRNGLDKFIKAAEENYTASEIKFDISFNNYRITSRYANHETIETLLNETIETVRSMADTVKSEVNMLDSWVDYRSSDNNSTFSKVTSYQTDLKSYTSKTSGYLTSLLSVQRSFQDNRNAVTDAEYAIQEKQLTLDDLLESPDDLEVRTLQNTICQKEDALQTAKENLVNCYLYAPFDGIISGVNVVKGDTVSSNTVLATVISNKQITEITLNESDIAEIQVGQKVTLSFDAIEDLTITGQVVEVDVTGTVSQGIVSYDVKIAFDIQNEQIKPGMSVTANIITDIKQDVVLVPNMAINQQDDISYVEVIVNGIEEQRTVQVGTSDDTNTEIISGLTEGEIIVTQIITATTAKTTQSQSATGTVRIPGVTTTGGGNFQPPDR